MWVPAERGTVNTESWVSLVAAAVSLAVTICVAVVTYRLMQRGNQAANRNAAATEDSAKSQRRAVDLAERQQFDAALDARRAKIHAEVRRTPSNLQGSRDQDHLLVFINSGSDGGRVTTVNIDGTPMHSFREFRGKTPVDAVIGPKGEAPFKFGRGRGGKLGQQFTVEIEWTDDSGVPGHWRGVLA